MTNQRVTKRDNDSERFKFLKLKKSIYKAATFIGGKDKKRAGEVAQEVKERIINKFGQNFTVKSKEIAQIVYQTLLDMDHGKTAQSYVIFKKVSNQIRNVKSLVDAHDLVTGYIDLKDWRVRENSNMAYSWQGLNFHISSTIQANYWLYSIYPNNISSAHTKGDLHIHDLGMLSVYCLGWDLRDLLIKGFTGVPGKISCAPPKHLSVALGQIVNFFYTLQHESAGAQAFSSFDTYLAPFIRYDKLSYKEVKQALQEFLFNMNVPTRVGCQTPFTNITMDLNPSGQLAEESVIIGGKRLSAKYKEFQKEMDILNRAFAEVMMEGDADGRLFSFPIPTYNLTKDFDWNNKVLDPAWEMTAKYGIPYFANYINSDMSPDDARSMCCRLRIDNRELRKRGGGLFGSNPLTGSIGVVTINMPRIGYMSKSKEEFFKRLGNLMNLAKESLLIKRKILEHYTEKGLYPYSKFYISSIKQRFGQYWKNHFNTIGLNGMNEACINFLGKDITTKEGRDFTLETLDFMRDKLMEYQKETKQIFNLEATPAEGASYRFAKIDKKLFPNIITASETNYLKSNSKNNLIKKNPNIAPYYTNSTQLPVDYTDDLFKALEHQDELQCKYTGGTVLHIYLGERLPSIEGTKKLIRKVAENYKLPYFSITPTFSICPKHGYLQGEHMYCPKCKEEHGYKKQKCEVYSRVVGYIRPIQQWNDGKQSEFKKRKTFKNH